MRILARGTWGVVAALLGAPLAAQELQPRALQNAPVGTNFVLLAAGYSRGNLLFDAALPLKDATADVWSVTPGYVRAIDVFGLKSSSTSAATAGRSSPASGSRTR